MPVGLLTVVTGIAILAGGLAAQRVYESAPTLSVVLAVLIGLGLYVLVRAVASRDTNASVRAGILVASTCFAIFYSIVLAGEHWRPHRSVDAVGRVMEALTLLARLMCAAALPIVIAAAAAWHARGEARGRVPTGALAPVLVSAGLSTAAFAISMGVFLAAVAAVPRGAAAYVALLLTPTLPIVFQGVWTYAYVRIVSRWEVEALPDSLVQGLANLRARCGFQFDRVICLDGRYGNGRIGAVASTLRSATLIMSEPLAALLDRDELLAVLAHETAHVELRHARRRTVFGLVATAVGLAVYVLLFVILNPVIPRELRLAQIIVMGMLLSVGRGAYDRLVTRRHEQEADAYAARAAGAGMLLRALEKLGAGRSPIRKANRWTTHSTWEIRSQRLRELAARETDP